MKKANEPSKVTRIAPTPSGYLHLGNAYNFLLTFLLARQNSAQILLRIDDFDQKRYRQAYTDNIFTTLERLGITWDKGPASVLEFEQSWSQKFRLERYEAVLQNLKQQNLVFECSCTRRELANTDYYPGTCFENPAQTDVPCSLRLRPKAKKVSFLNWQGNSNSFDFPGSLQHVVLQRKDGLPSYQLVSLTDDFDYGVNQIVRGIDLFPSTLCQVYISHKLNFELHKSHFLHHRLIEGQSGLKLSKSQKAAPIDEALKTRESSAHLFREFSAWLGLKRRFSDLREIIAALQNGDEELNARDIEASLDY